MADTTKKIKITLKQTCSICLDKISSADKCTTDCKHIFHRKCIDTWDRADCPMCRSDTGLHKVSCTETWAERTARWREESRAYNISWLELETRSIELDAIIASNSI